MSFVEIAVIYNVPLDKLRTNVEELQKAGFSERPRFECFVAEVPPEQKSKEGHTLIGYVLSVYTYSTWRGRNLYMDNLYVMPEFRGMSLKKKAPGAAWRRGCNEIRMHASSEKVDNIKILQRWGGQNLTDKEGWNLLRFHEDVLQRLAAPDKI
ncbi:hypothetical protein JD844_000784 [Phrynosoma platyrhinos]|uniref:Diamine acetyltransferase 2-like n=1 Tax=Phrynosoma platyrhinos TaxID=52577 RepID=A0ABQ7T8K8_PHRPL|nr:hypothetical protein JD844_000784 [Phrynosoma platyrhinos]